MHAYACRHTFHFICPTEIFLFNLLFFLHLPPGRNYLTFFFLSILMGKNSLLAKKEKKNVGLNVTRFFFFFFFLTKRKNHVTLLVVPFLKSSWTNKAVSVFLTHGCLLSLLLFIHYPWKYNENKRYKH